LHQVLPVTIHQTLEEGRASFLSIERRMFHNYAPFIRRLKEWTRANGAILIFDEVITFRTTLGGAQELYDVQPELTALGKVIGGGFPVGAVSGRPDVGLPWDCRSYGF